MEDVLIGLVNVAPYATLGALCVGSMYLCYRDYAVRKNEKEQKENALSKERYELARERAFMTALNEMVNHLVKELTPLPNTPLKTPHLGVQFSVEYAGKAPFQVEVNTQCSIDLDTWGVKLVRNASADDIRVSVIVLNRHYREISIFPDNGMIEKWRQLEELLKTKKLPMQLSTLMTKLSLQHINKIVSALPYEELMKQNIAVKQHNRKTVLDMVQNEIESIYNSAISLGAK